MGRTGSTPMNQMQGQSTQGQGMGFQPQAVQQGPSIVDYILSALPALIQGIGQGAAMGSPGLGIAAGATKAIPGLASTYADARSAKAANQLAVMRQRGQYTGAELAGASASQMSGLQGASPDVYKQAIGSLGDRGAQVYTNNMLSQLGINVPQGAGAPPASYQSALINQIGSMANKAYGNPTVDQISSLLNSGELPEATKMGMLDRLQQLSPVSGNEALKYSPANPDMALKRGTLSDDILAGKAKSQAEAMYAIPEAEESLRGKKATNRRTQLEGDKMQTQMQYYPEQMQQEATLRGADIQGKELDNIKKQQLYQEHMRDQLEAERLDVFKMNMFQLDQTEQDPELFRQKAIKMLEDNPVPPAVLQNAIEVIEGIATEKQQKMGPQRGGGLFGIGR